MKHGLIYFTEWVNGWYVIHGVIGKRRYLWYSKREAEHRYRVECVEKIKEEQ